MVGHNQNHTESVMWINAAETFVKISQVPSLNEGLPGKKALFITESGALEFFILASTVSPQAV